MKFSKLNIAMAIALSTSAFTLVGYGGTDGKDGVDGVDGKDAVNQSTSSSTSSSRTIKSVAFSETPAPSTADKIAKTYSESVATVTYTDGTEEKFSMAFNKLFGVADKVGTSTNAAGQLYDMNMKPLKDPLGKPVIAETPDSNSLLKVGDKMFMVSHLEYDWLLSDGSVGYKAANWYSRMPMSMILTEMTQDATTGKLTAKDQKALNFSGVEGLWIPCAGSQTPWNTHLGSEEDYDLQYNPTSPSYSSTTSGIKALSNLYFNSTKVANPYHYGHIPEITVKEDGSTTIVKHYSMGRASWEMAKVMPDSKTVYFGDDGKNVGSFMYIADKAEDLSSGTLYAAKATQTGAYSADIEWVKLGHATDKEVKALADAETFDTIFTNATFNATTKTCPTGTTRVRAGSTTDECLAVKSAKETAAAFLETRRYAALLGATIEFNKMEGIAVNDADKKLYMAISYLDRGMLDNSLPSTMEHLKMQKINAGATLTMPMAAGQDDTAKNLIASDYVVTGFYIEDGLRGRDIATDALGNTADPSFIANPDNVYFSEKMRTLFVGEDSGTHVNNFVWAYNVDTKKLTRVLSVIAGAESTGLQVVEDMNGHAYIMSNSQHHGDYIKTMDATKKAEVEAIGVTKIDAGDFGYIGGLPAFK